MAIEKQCRACAKDRNEFREDLNKQVGLKPLADLFEKLRSRIPWLGQFPNATTAIDAFYDIKDEADPAKNKAVARLVKIIKTDSTLATPTLYFLLSCLMPALKRLGCKYCTYLVPVYEPFAEAYYQAYRVIAKGKFKQGDLVLLSLIRQVNSALLRLSKKEHLKLKKPKGKDIPKTSLRCEHCGQPIINLWYLKLIRLCDYCYGHLFGPWLVQQELSLIPLGFGLDVKSPTPIRNDWTYKWNYEISDTLREAVVDKVITQIEAEIVMEYAGYERSFDYIAQELKLSFSEVITHYETALGKLREYLRP